MSMNRTQVYLTDDIVAGVKALAKKMRLPEAKIIRELLAEALQRRQDVPAPVGADALIGKYGSGHSATSRNVDQVVYGRK
jgi:hypothetical protein